MQSVSRIENAKAGRGDLDVGISKLEVDAMTREGELGVVE